MKLSVVVRCRNEASSLKLTLESLCHQSCDFEWEIILVDNESTDNTVAIAENFGARIVAITASEFSYGRALNLGFSHARGELIMPLSAHSVLLGTNALAEAVKPFADPRVAAARCLSNDAVSSLAQWFNPVDLQKREFHEANTSAIPVVDPGEWHGKKHINNACSVIRKSVWEETAFDEALEAAEDRLWSTQVYQAGYKIRHCAQCTYLYNRVIPPGVHLLRHQRNLLAAYRTGLYQPLGFTGMLSQIAKAPFTALRHGAKTAREQLQHELGIATYSYSIPRRARQTHKGSYTEYDPPPK